MVFKVMQLPMRFGRYVLLSKIATGGMAEIYRAKYLGEGGFEKTVAVKRLLPSWSANHEFVTMLIDEAKAQVHLQHPNIVQVIELGKEQESYFLSMELVEGLDLGHFFSKIVRDNIALPPKFTIYIISQILQALDFAHGQSMHLVHRDISPPNVLLSWNGEVKVADFGIAKGAHRSYKTVTSQVKGKYSYMSPEQARGENIDKRTDIYAAGILFYELLTGKRLYEAVCDLEVIELVKKSKIPQEHLKSIDAKLKNILLRALKTKPYERYQSAKEFLSDLNAYAFTHNLISSAYEFGGYLKEIFPNEVSKNEQEIRKDTDAFSKTLLFEKKDKWPIYIERIKYLSRFYGGMTAILLLCIFLPGGTKIDLPDLKAPQLTIAKTETKLPNPVTNLPAVIKKEPGIINVQAKPWGYVTIPGYVAKKETPLNGLKVKPGKYLVKVYYAPANQWLSRNIKVTSGGKTNCLATFGKKPALRCR